MVYFLLNIYEIIHINLKDSSYSSLHIHISKRFLIYISRLTKLNQTSLFLSFVN